MVLLRKTDLCSMTNYPFTGHGHEARLSPEKFISIQVNNGYSYARSLKMEAFLLKALHQTKGTAECSTVHTEEIGELKGRNPGSRTYCFCF